MKEPMQGGYGRIKAKVNTSGPGDTSMRTGVDELKTQHPIDYKSRGPHHGNRTHLRHHYGHGPKVPD